MLHDATTLLDRRRLLALAAALPAAACGRGEPRSLVDSAAATLPAGVARHEPPFLARYDRGRRRLAFAAVRHELGFASPSHVMVRQVFEKDPPLAVIAEGFPTAWGESPDRIAEVARTGASWGAGESGYAVRLALATGAPFWGGEPEERDVNAALLAEGWTPEDLLGDTVLKMLPQTVRAGQIAGPDDPRLEAHLLAWIEAARAEIDAPPAFDRAAFEAWYGETFAVAFAEDPLYADRHRPDRDHRFSRLVDRQMALRDEHLLRVIREHLAAEGRVLTVYGAAHLYTLWRALEGELGPPEIVERTTRA